MTHPTPEGFRLPSRLSQRSSYSYMELIIKYYNYELINNKGQS